MPAIKLVLDSRDGDVQNNTPANVSWIVADALRDLNNKQVNWIQLASATIPNTMYNIIDSNNTLAFDLYDPTGVTLLSSHTITIPRGHYNGNEFIAAVNSYLSASGNTYTLSIEALTDLITITNNTGNQILLKFNESTMMRVLGYLEDQKGVSVLANRPPDLRGVTDVLIQSNITQNKPVRYSGSNGSTNTFLGIIPVNVAYGNTIYYTNENMRDIIECNKIPDNIEIQLRNRKNLPLEINSFEFKIILIINYE